MNILDLVATLTLNAKEFVGGLKENEDLAKGFGSKFGSALGTAAAVGGAALMAATGAAVAFGKSSVEAGMGFDSSMSQLAATMGMTQEEIHKAGGEFEQLREFAQKMGSETQFSASESADALNILAMAGYGAKEQMETLPAVLNLAAAGGLGIAEAADYATGIIAGFSNETLDASTIADKLAKVASSAKGDVASFGEGLSTVAGMATTTGQSMQDMTVALGILGNNNVSASEAGNALSRTLKNLYQATDSSAKQMKELGISAYDAEGNARPLQEVLADINKAMDGMSEQQKNDILGNIFDAATLKTVPALLNNVGDAWDDLDKKIAESEGAAESMREAMTDNLAGDITEFNSALEGLQIAVSDTLTGSAREFVQFGTNALQNLRNGFKNGGINGAMEALGTILSDGLNMVIEKLPAAVEAGGKLLSALGQGIIDNIPLLVDSAVTIIKMLVQYLQEAIPALLEAAIEIIFELAHGIVEALPELVPAIVEVILTICEILTEPDMLMELIDAAFQILGALALGIIKALPTLIEKAPIIIANFLEALFRFLPEIVKGGMTLLIELAKGIVNAGGEITQALGKIFSNIKETISKWPNNFRDWGKDLIQNFIEGIKSRFSAVSSAFSSLGSLIRSFIHFSEPDVGPLSDFSTYAPDMMKTFAEGIKANEDLVKDQIASSFDFGGLIAGGAQGSLTAINSGSATGTAKQLTVILELDRQVFGKAVYKLNNEETQRVGVKLAGGYGV